MSDASKTSLETNGSPKRAALTDLPAQDEVKGGAAPLLGLAGAALAVTVAAGAGYVLYNATSAVNTALSGNSSGGSGGGSGGSSGGAGGEDGGGGGGKKQ